MSNLSVSPSQTDVERREAERETTLRYMAAQGFALMPMDALFLLSEIERLRGALHESRKDRERLDWLDAQREPVSSDGETLDAYAWGIYGRNHTIREAIDATRSGNGETT